MCVQYLCFFAALCSVPADPANGAVTYYGLSEGDIAAYTCDEGYTLVGNNTATCVVIDDDTAVFLPDVHTCERKQRHNNNIYLGKSKNPARAHDSVLWLCTASLYTY